jgi:signal-transduction protein with cAMP-binding, CBS, and nucleotidyltransferase domain
MASVKDIMVKKVITFTEDDNLMDAAKAMKKKNAGSVIIVKDDKPIGIITERDLTQKVVAENVNPSLAKTKQIMVSPLITVEPEADIYYASKMMEDKKIKKMPVAENGKLVGIITMTDLAKYFTAQRKKFVLKHLDKSSREEYPS